MLATRLYRRLLYFANLLLCSAAILKKESEKKPGVDREVRESTDERGWGRRGGGHIINGNVQGLLEDSRCPESETRVLSSTPKAPKA